MSYVEYILYSNLVRHANYIISIWQILNTLSSGLLIVSTYSAENDVDCNKMLISYRRETALQGTL